MRNRRPLAHPADDPAAIDAREQSVEIRIVLRVRPYDGVLDGGANPIAKNSLSMSSYRRVAAEFRRRSIST